MRYLILLILIGGFNIGFSQTNVIRLPSDKKYFILDTISAKHLAISLDTLSEEALIFTDTTVFKSRKKLDFYNNTVYYYNVMSVIPQYYIENLFENIFDKFNVLADGNLKGFISIPTVKYSSKNKYSKCYVEGLCVFLLMNNDMLLEDLKKQNIKNTLLRPMGKGVYIPMVIYVSSTDKAFIRTDWEGYHKIKDKLLPAR